MIAFSVPIQPGKFDLWSSMMAELNGARKESFRDFNKRYGLTRHRAFLQALPDGNRAVVVLIEGRGEKNMFTQLAASTHPFDVWFRGAIVEVHGMDLTKPPEMPELRLDLQVPAEAERTAERH
jgi:hypothetical protein